MKKAKSTLQSTFLTSVHEKSRKLKLVVWGVENQCSTLLKKSNAYATNPTNKTLPIRNSLGARLTVFQSHGTRIF
jgi:hypothetical protein